MNRPRAAAVDVPGVTFRAASATDALCLSVLGTQVFPDTYATGGIGPSLAREVAGHLSVPAVSALLAMPAVRFLAAELAGHMLGASRSSPKAPRMTGWPRGRQPN